MVKFTLLVVAFVIAVYLAREEGRLDGIRQSVNLVENPPKNVPTMMAVPGNLADLIRELGPIKDDRPRVTIKD